MLFGVPTMYHRLAARRRGGRRARRRAGRARLLVSGSAALPAPEHERIERLTGQQIVERYGLTETLMNTAVRADGERRPGYVGAPLPGVEVRLVDDDGGESTTPTTRRSARSPCAARTSSSATSTARTRPPRRCATAGSSPATWPPARADGYVRIVGRRSTDLIKTGGYRVGAGEIEAALLEHPAVPRPRWRASPTTTSASGSSPGSSPRRRRAPTEKELIDHVAAVLAPHKRPREVRFLDELPRNAMGKVLKRASAVTLQSAPPTGRRSPSTPTATGRR